MAKAKANRPFNVVQPNGSYDDKKGVKQTDWITIPGAKVWITDDGKGIRIENCVNYPTKVDTLTDRNGNQYTVMTGRDMIVKFDQFEGNDDVPASKPKKAKKAPTIVPVEDDEPQLPF